MSKYCLALSHILKVMFRGTFHTTFLICEKLFFNMQSGKTQRHHSLKVKQHKCSKIRLRAQLYGFSLL